MFKIPGDAIGGGGLDYASSLRPTGVSEGGEEGHFGSFPVFGGVCRSMGIQGVSGGWGGFTGKKKNSVFIGGMSSLLCPWSRDMPVNSLKYLKSMQIPPPRFSFLTINHSKNLTG